MAYDPSKPANGAPILSAELRDQFAGLKALIDDLQAQLADRPTSAQVQQMILDQSAGAVTQVVPMDLAISDPPTQAEVDSVSGTLDSLITELRR
jgi:hypothetical protein